MKNDLKNVYKIIPPDYLYYIEGQDHRSPLSEEEVDFVISYCIDIGLEDMDKHILPIIRKLEFARIAQITCERFFKGELDISYVTEEGDIIWKAKD